jgi:hypothetical protein
MTANQAFSGAGWAYRSYMEPIEADLQSPLDVLWGCTCLGYNEAYARQYQERLRARIAAMPLGPDRHRRQAVGGIANDSVPYVMKSASCFDKSSNQPCRHQSAPFRTILSEPKIKLKAFVIFTASVQELLTCHKFLFRFPSVYFLTSRSCGG